MMNYLDFTLVVGLCLGVTLYEISGTQAAVIAVSSLIAKTALICIMMLKGVDVWVTLAVGCIPLSRILEYMKEKLN